MLLRNGLQRAWPGGLSSSHGCYVPSFTAFLVNAPPCTPAQEVLLREGRAHGRPAHCVGMVRAPETVEVANFLIDKMGRGALTAELLQPDELVAGIIAQVRDVHENGRALLWSRTLNRKCTDANAIVSHKRTPHCRLCTRLSIFFAIKWNFMAPPARSPNGNTQAQSCFLGPHWVDEKASSHRGHKHATWNP